MIRSIPKRSSDPALSAVNRVLDAEGRADPDRDPHLDPKLVVRVYQGMLRARIVDDRMLALQRQGRIGFHVGYRGEEAAVVASAAALRDTDWIFPCYRELGALLWRGFSLERYLDHMYGNADDTVKGRQMPDHVVCKALRYASVSSPIGTQISQAVGLAWAGKLQHEDVVAAVYFGDGATSSPDFHTGLNFAGVHHLPCVFLCRNNRWAISTPSEKQTASETIATKAVAYGIRGVRCDGNDALAVYATVHEAVRRAAQGEGPTLVEMMTYRLGGHSTSDDPKVYRPEGELERFLKLDPLLRLRRHVETLGAWSEREEVSFVAEVEAELKQCIARAEGKAPPGLDTMFDDVFRERTLHLDEQYAECAAGARPRREH